MDKPLLSNSPTSPANLIDQVIQDISQIQLADAKLSASASVQPKAKVEIAIVIALQEEFNAITSLLPTKRSKQPAPVTEHWEHYFKWPLADDYSPETVILVCGMMGEVDAAVATYSLLSRLNSPPKILASIGIAGGIHDDVRLCDVVVSNSLDRYAEEGKMTAGKGKGYQLEFGGKHEDPGKHWPKIASVLQSDYPDVLTKWSDQGAADLESKLRLIVGASSTNQEILRDRPLLKNGPTSSGPFVVSCTAFRALLNSRNRNILSVDMESGGVIAASKGMVRNPESTIVIRGISDFGDERKRKLDTKYRGAVRAVAMRNATRMFQQLLIVAHQYNL